MVGKQDKPCCASCLYLSVCEHAKWRREQGITMDSKALCSIWRRDTPQARKAAAEEEIERAFDDESYYDNR